MKAAPFETKIARGFSLQRLGLQGNLLITLLALVLLVIVSAVISPAFRSPYNLSNVLVQAVALGLISLGQTLVILGGGIDLSVGSIVSLVSCLTAGLMMGVEGRLLPVLIAMVLLGALIGLANGLIVTRLRVAPFIVTLGMMSVVQGAVFLYTKNPVGKIPKAFRFLAEGQIGPFPFPVLLLLALIILSWFVLRRTTFGRYVYAAGGNEEVARLSGIRTPAIRLATYILAGVSAALTGLFLTSRLRVGQPLVGQGYELDSITAVLIGGTALSGGRGGVIGTTLGVLIMIVLSNILNLMNVSSYWQWIVKGLIIIGALAAFRSER